jgi:hypothetical protein
MKRGEDSDIRQSEKLCSIFGSDDRKDSGSLRGPVEDSLYACSLCGRASSNKDSVCLLQLL